MEPSNHPLQEPQQPRVFPTKPLPPTPQKNAPVVPEKPMPNPITHNAAPQRSQTVRDLMKSVSVLGKQTGEMISNVFDKAFGKKEDPITTFARQLDVMLSGMKEGSVGLDTLIEMSKYLEKSGSETLKTTYSELKETHLAYQRAKESKNETRAVEIGLRQTELDARLNETYLNYAELRKALKSAYDNADDQGKDKILQIHANLSAAMMQHPDSDLTSSVIWNVPPISNFQAFRAIIQDKHSRDKMKNCFKVATVGLIKSVKYYAVKPFKGEKTTEEAQAKEGVATGAVEGAPKKEIHAKKIETSPLKRAWAVITNNIASLSLPYARLVFGKDLKSASRNVASTLSTMGDEDLKATDRLRTKIEGMSPSVDSSESKDKKKKITLENGSKIAIKKTTSHISDGICGGISLELAVAANRDPDKHFINIAGRFAKGAISEAHANQACYQNSKFKDIKVLAYLDSAMTNRLQHALDPKNGSGIFKADYKNVSWCFEAIAEGKRTNDGGSKLGTAVLDVLAEHRELKVWNENVKNYITDTKKFKELVLEKLGPDADVTTKNELEWLIGTLEMKSVMHALHDHINLEDVGLNRKGAKLSVDNYYEFISNADPIGKLLYGFIDNEMEFDRLNVVAQARGAKLERTENDLGHAYAARNDAEILDRVDNLPPGSYMVSITLKGVGHFMLFRKTETEQFLYDPNFGTIDCSGGRAKEQFTKLLSLPVYAPGPDKQGPYSDGTSHMLQFTRVVNVEGQRDLLMKSVATI